MRHWRYLKYIIRHKWFVFLAGCKLGIPLLTAMHDNSKLRPSEWFPYVASFYGKQGRTPAVREAFDLAWLLHQKRNRHHWQFWILQNDTDGLRILPMPDRYRREMLADWWGAGKAQGKRSPPDDPWRETRAWYRANKDKLQLHPDTRAWVEDRLGVHDAILHITRETA